MKAHRRGFIGFMVLVCAFAAGCGYIGDPLPPALNIPERVANLSVQEVGDRLIIEFTLPTVTTEGLPVRDLEPAQIRISGELVEPGPAKDGVVRTSLPAAKWAGRTVNVVVSAVMGSKASEPASMEITVIPPLARPEALAAEADPKGVRLTWRPEPGRSGVAYKVSRRASAKDDFTPLGTVTEASYVDAAAVYGQTYQYTVSAESGRAVSEIAGPVEITPTDRFPPSIPSGITVISGVNSIELAWERVPESDLRGYRIHRALKGAEPAVLSDLVESPAYSDRQVESGKTYVYAITSVDAAGNESPRSQQVEMTAP